jgi:hypothetical protein
VVSRTPVRIDRVLNVNRAMNDCDGPFVAKTFYKKLFKSETIDLDTIPYALDYAVRALRETGAPPERWATYVHMGA